MKSISITVPMDYAALTRASDMLHGMAIDVRNGVDAPHIEARTPASEGGTMPDPNHVPDEDYGVDPAYFDKTEEKDAASVFGSGATSAPVATAPENARPAGAATAGAAKGVEEAGPTDSPNEPAQPAPGAASPGEASEDTGTTGVELDSDGLPWDSRIHAGSKTKLKKSQQWKPKRGVDPELKAEVEAELRAAMGAGGEPAKPAAPAAPAEPQGAITTFPALMSRITAAGVTQEQANAAAKNQGLPSLPLLATRPDLIPAVAAELFPEG